MYFHLLGGFFSLFFEFFFSCIYIKYSCFCLLFFYFGGGVFFSDPPLFLPALVGLKEKVNREKSSYNELIGTLYH